MKRLYIFSIAVILALIGTMYILPYFQKVNNLPSDMVVTFQDIDRANSQNEFSPIFKLSTDKNITASTPSEPIDTTLKVKLFNLFTFIS